MREQYEFRLMEDDARRFLRSDDGIVLGGSVRKVVVNGLDPLFDTIGRFERSQQRKGDIGLTSWSVRRQYSEDELNAAAMFRIIPPPGFQPTGEMCGTVYDQSTACAICGAGRTQASGLLLDLRKLPKNKDIAKSLASEWVVSQRLAEILVDSSVTGIELWPVIHRARYMDDPIDMQTVPSGQELLKAADARGLVQGSWEFIVWLNKSDQSHLVERMRSEHARVQKVASTSRKPNLPKWYQLVVVSQHLLIDSRTQFGINPFDGDSAGQYRCPTGDTMGFKLLSELYVRGDSRDGSDFAVTAQFVGVRSGELEPERILVVSPRVRQLLIDNGIKDETMDIVNVL